MGSIIVALDQLIDGTATKSQAFDMILKKNLSGYNNVIKIKERAFNPLNRDRLRFSKLYSEFEEEVFEAPNIELENTTRTKYFKDLSTMFYTGTEDEFAKQLALTYVAIAHDYLRINKADTPEEAFKMATEQLNKKLTSMNPNKATLFKTTNKGKKTSVKFINDKKRCVSGSLDRTIRFWNTLSSE